MAVNYGRFAEPNRYKMTGFLFMGSRRSNPNTDQYFPISKQTVGGVAGAIVGSAIAGTVGAVVGGVAGTLMGNRTARGESLVSTRTLNSVKDV